MFIVWGAEMELSRRLARALGAEARQVYYKKIWGVNLPALIRYLAQSAATLLILFKNRPEAVIVQNPPVFAPLAVLLYCKLSGARFAIDSHTAAFLDDKWIKFYRLFKFAAKRACLNSCHNYKNLEILNSWGIEPALAMQFFNPRYDPAELAHPMHDECLEKVLTTSKLPVMMVNRFADDDDWQTVIKTAELMPDADFFITGEPRRQIGKSDNVFLTGYLAHQEFLKLMRRCRVILALTLRPDTVLWSIREIMALNKPFVTTDSEVSRHYFGKIGVFAKPGAPELKEKILSAAENEADIKNKIKIFLEHDKSRWEDEIANYKKYIS